MSTRPEQRVGEDAAWDKAEKALEYYRPDQLFLNTDCGFGCFASRSVNVEDVAFKKLCAITESAKQLRKKVL